MKPQPMRGDVILDSAHKCTMQRHAPLLLLIDVECTKGAEYDKTPIGKPGIASSPEEKKGKRSR